MLHNFLGFPTQLVCKNYCIPQKNFNVFQTLLFTKETSTYNFVHKVSKNCTPTYLKQMIGLFQKILFLKVFYSEAILLLINNFKFSN